MRRRRTLLLSSAAVLSLVMATLLVLPRSAFAPAHEELGVEILLEREPRAVRPSVLRVLTWNIHYGAGQYDDRGNLRKLAEVKHNLDGIAQTVCNANADLVFLQEVDFDSRRSHFLDELTLIAQTCGYRYAARVVTWDVPYLPYPYWPPSQHYKKVVSGQAVLSRFPIIKHEVWRYPKPKSNPWWYNLFYLRRTTQLAVINHPSGQIAAFNVHLEAFDQANREDQARRLNRTVAQALKQYRFVVVAGDFNAIPKEAKLRKGFPDEPETDMTTDQTLELFLKGLNLYEALFEALGVRDGKEVFTFPSYGPNRRLDYIFASNSLNLVSAKVLTQCACFSDHLPVQAEFKFAME